MTRQVQQKRLEAVSKDNSGIGTSSRSGRSLIGTRLDRRNPVEKCIGGVKLRNSLNSKQENDTLTSSACVLCVVGIFSPVQTCSVPRRLTAARLARVLE